QESFVGSLAVKDVDGDQASRVFTSGRCAEVATALALVAAVAIEERAPAKKIVTIKLPELVAPPPAPPAPPRPLRGGAGASPGLLGGAAPSALLAGSAFFELSRGEGSLRLGVLASMPQTAPVGDAAARFSVALVRLD